jgi:hypothetical protein
MVTKPSDGTAYLKMMVLKRQVILQNPERQPTQLKSSFTNYQFYFSFIPHF